MVARFAAMRAGQFVQLARPDPLDQRWPLARVDDHPHGRLELSPRSSDTRVFGQWTPPQRRQV